jgi:hypothetical protein
LVYVGCAVVVAVLVAGGLWLGLRPSRLSGCGNPTQLSVAVTPELGPVVQDAANRWTSDRRVPGRCVSIVVTAASPVDVAAVVAGKGHRVTGLDQPDGRTPRPDIWIPDSSVWLLRLRTADTNLVPATAPSLGTSPVVIAMPEPVATSLGWIGARLTWPVVLQQMVTDKRLHVGIVNPNRDAAATSTLVALGDAVSAFGSDGGKVAVDTLHSFADGGVPAPAALLIRFPTKADQQSLAAGLALAPLPEQAVLAYNASHPGVRLTALSLDPAPAGLDYPYVVLPRLPADRAEAAAGFLRAVTDNAFRAQLGQLWIRSPDGTPGPDFPVARAMPAPPSAVPDASAITKALSNWAEITRRDRMLAVIDVSGSMQSPVPTAGGATREQVAVAAAKGGLALFENSWEVGLWIFAAGLDGDKDYQQLVPIGPLSTQRGALNAALDTVAPKPNRATGLHDTILAAYRAMQDGWAPGRGNSVVVITDGKNDDPNGLTQDQLLAELKKTADPKRPIQVILLGIGTEVTEADLSPIPQVTGGAAYVTADPAQIGNIFTKALALHPGR